jgi:hypothetical protein
LVGCGKDEFSELADANGVYRMNWSRRRGGIRLISGDMSEEFEPKSEPSLDRVEGGERPGPGAFLIRRPGPVWLWSLSSGGREESEPARAGGTYNLSGMCGGVAGPPISRARWFGAVQRECSARLFLRKWFIENKPHYPTKGYAPHSGRGRKPRFFSSFFAKVVY